MGYIIKLKTDKSMEVLETDTPPTLEEMQSAVGGYVEFIREVSYVVEVEGALEVTEDAVLVINEEGIPLGLGVNPMASMMACQPILGDAMLIVDLELD